MEKAIFKTKFVADMNRNNQIVKVIEYLGNDMYMIEFEDKKRLKVYDNELKPIKEEK